MRLGNRQNGDQGCGCGGPRNACDTHRVVSIVRDGDDVIIAFNDCTFIKATYSVVNKNLKESEPGKPENMDEVVEQLEVLKTKLQNLENSVVNKSDLVEESHTSFADDDIIIKTLKFKEN